MLIAKRNLEYATRDGATTPIPICLFAPKESNGDWRCRYAIDWRDGRQEEAGYGVDAMQALILTSQMIGTRIYCSD